MAQDRPLLGILLMTGFCLLAPLADALAKLLMASVPLLLVMLVRFAAQGVLLLPLRLHRGWPRYDRRVWILLSLRTGLHLGGVGCMFAGLRVLPLADAVAIAYVMPFIALLLGWRLLGEQVGWARLLGCGFGFVGTLMVMQPSFVSVGWSALLPVAVAVIFAFYMLVTRMLATADDPISLQAINGLQATGCLLLLAMVIPDWLGEGAGQVARAHWALLVIIGMVGTLGHLLMTWALRFAPSATLAPMQYLEIPVATGLGWMIFRDLPDPMAAAGIVVTMAAGLFVIHKERRRARQERLSP